MCTLSALGVVGVGSRLHAALRTLHMLRRAHLLLWDTRPPCGAELACVPRRRRAM
jgi:hypothetical protein